MARNRWFVLLPCVALALAARPGAAQDPAPSATETPPLPPSPSAPEPPPEPSPAPAAPDGAASSEPPVAPAPTTGSEPPAPASPSPAPGVEPSTGNAAFAPLPASPSEPKKPRAHVAPAASSSASAPASTPAPPARGTGDDPPITPPAAEQPAEKDDSGGLFGPFRIGFLLGGGLPDLLSLGGAIKLTRYLGGGINVGLIPTVKVSYYGEATLSYQEYDAYGRIYPFGGAVFVGAGVGYATVRGSLANTFKFSPAQLAMYPGLPIPASLEVSSQASVRTLVLTPQLGLLHTFGSGFSIGADIGAQVPIAPSKVDFSTQVPAAIPQAIKDQYVTPNDNKVRASLDKIGRTPIPTFNVKIGWLL